MKQILIIVGWFFKTITLELFTLTAVLIAPLAWYWPKTFSWYLDNEILNPKTNADYKLWLLGKKNNFWTFYRWHGFRNRMWNFRMKFTKAQGKEVLMEVILNTLKRNGWPVPATETAAWKWIDKNGNEGWQVNSGVKISTTYSTVGTVFMFYRVANKNYFRYSTAQKIKVFNKMFYISLKLGTNDKRNVLTFKIQA